MPTQDLNHNPKKVNLRYILLPVVIGIFLLLSSTLSEWTVSRAAEAAVIGETPTNVWTVIKTEAEAVGTPAPITQNIVAVHVEQPYQIFLPIIFKTPYQYDENGILILPVLVNKYPAAAPIANVVITITPPNPTLTVPATKPTVTPLPTATATPNIIPDGNFEGDNDFHWRTYSLRGHRVIFDTSDPSLPVLPVDPPSPTHAAWLGGDDSEITYIETSFFLPLEKPYIFFQYYIQSYDPICSANLFSDVTRRLQFQFANPNSVNNLQSDVGGFIITDGVTVGVDVIDLCAGGNTGAGSITYDTLPFAGKNVTIRFQMVGDNDLSSSFFIDDVALRSDFSASAVDLVRLPATTLLVEPQFIEKVGPIMPVATKETNPLLLNLAPFQK